MDICVGITSKGDDFGVKLKSKSFVSEKITNFQYDRINVLSHNSQVMKHMRKDLCILGTQTGEVLILAFDTQPPSVIKKYKDIDRAVIDLIYDDEFK